MTVVIAKQYEKDLRVDGSMKARAWDFMIKLNADPDGGGLDLKLPQGAADRRVRTARVDQNFRAVMFLVSPSTFVMAAIKPHDEAYEFAISLRLEINAANGAMEIFAERAISVAVEELRAKPRPVDAPQLLPFTTTELTGVGIRPDVAEQAVRISNEDSLLTLVEDLPDWQQQALLDLATGKSLDDVRSDYGVREGVNTSLAESLRLPVTRMQFVTVSDDDDLRRMIEGDFEEWRTFLHPQQRTLAERPTYSGPFRLAGGAGTGKTVVALHRAAYLARRPDARVLLCTYNRTLAGALEAQLRRLASPDVVARVDVLGIDQSVHRTVRDHDGEPPRPVDTRTQDRLWDDAIAAAAVPPDLAAALTPEFLSTELRTVAQGLPALTQENYLAAKRTGRGVRLNRLQRLAVWRVLEGFRKSLDGQRSTTFELLSARAADIATTRYDHIVVDEGQDLHAAHWRYLRALAVPGPNDLFICEDAYQRIYGERLILSRYGIETRGRSRRLTLNYRSSRQNLRFALGVIAGARVVNSEDQLETVAGYRAAFDGPEPTLRGFRTTAEEADCLATTVAGWLADGAPPEALGVLVRRQIDQERARQALQQAGIAFDVLSATGVARGGSVTITTMHRAKGMEFSRVIVFGAAAGVVPLDFVVDQFPEGEREIALARERSLLYVACSRARDVLVVTWTGTPSSFVGSPQMCS